jgi:hypothetical protein
MFNILKACIGEFNVKEISMEYQHSALLKLELWRLIQGSKEVSHEQKAIRPGEKLIQERRMRLNNLDKPLLTEADYKKRSRRATKKEAILFERYLPEGIETLTKRMFSDNLRIKKIKTLKKTIQQIEEKDSDDSD